MLNRGSDKTLFVWVASNIIILFFVLQDSYLLDRGADKTLYIWFGSNVSILFVVSQYSYRLEKVLKKICMS